MPIEPWLALVHQQTVSSVVPYCCLLVEHFTRVKFGVKMFWQVLHKFFAVSIRKELIKEGLCEVWFCPCCHHCLVLLSVIHEYCQV